MNTEGNSEQYCAAVDECLVKTNNNFDYCNTEWPNYVNPNWVSGDCGVQ
jgi:hypothetical protein